MYYSKNQQKAIPIPAGYKGSAFIPSLSEERDYIEKSPPDDAPLSKCDEHAEIEEKRKENSPLPSLLSNISLEDLLLLGLVFLIHREDPNDPTLLLLLLLLMVK